MAYTKSFHLAGIVPIAQRLETDFGFEWSDVLMPIAPNYTAVERAVMECAYAGCETIWLVCNQDMTPLIKHRIGEWVTDPNTAKGPYNTYYKRIPIHYIPISSKDRHKRDCLAWSALWGAEVAAHVSHKVSKWVDPDRFYVSFPFGVYPPNVVEPHRIAISSAAGFYLRHKNQTVRDGAYLGFTFTPDEHRIYKKVLRNKSTGEWEGYKKPRLPIHKRYSARWFTLDIVFGDAILDHALVLETPWYFKIDSWDAWCTYLGSEHRKDIKRPSKKCLLASNRKWNRIGHDD